MHPKLLLMLLPGTVFWVLVVVGLVTGSTAVWVATGVVGAATAVGFLTMRLRGWTRTRARNKRVWADGIPATARVVSATVTGRMNDNPQVRMSLEVTVPHQSPRTVEVRQLISQLMVARIEPDKEIAVKVDRDDPEVVVVDEELTPYGY